MMRIEKNNVASVQSFLKQVGLAAEAGTPMGKKVSLEEAKGIATAFDAITDPAAKQSVQTALLQLVQSDAFEVTGKQAQEVIAKVLGKPQAEVFSERARAELVGGASLKKVGAAVLQHLAKTPELSKAQTETLLKNLQDLPKSAQVFLTAALKNASADNLFKFQPDARPAFTKTFAKLEGETDGGVTKMADKLQGSGLDKRMSYFANRMMNSPFIEDQIAAIMFMVVNDTMREVQEGFKEMQALTQADAKKSEDAEAAKKKAQAGGAAALAQGAGKTGGASSVTPTTTTTTNTNTTNTNTAPTDSKDRVANLRTQYEGLTKDVAAFRTNDGVIDVNEAKSLVARLDGIDPAAKKLQAQSLGRALQYSLGNGGMENAQPLADWVKKTLGVKSLEDIPGAKGLYESKSPIAQAIGGADKLENKVAASMIEGLFAPTAQEQAAFKKQMVEMQPMLEQIQKQSLGKAVVPPAERVMDSIGRIASALEKPGVAESLGDVAKIATKLAERAGVPPAAQAAVVSGATAALTALKAGKSLVDATKAANAPLAKEAFDKPVPGAKVTPETVQGDQQAKQYLQGVVESAQHTTAREFSAAADVGKVLTPEQKQTIWQRNLDAAKGKASTEMQAQGLTPDQAAAALSGIDVFATAAGDELQKTGKMVEPDAPSGTEAVAPTDTNDTRSRQIMFEQLKLRSQAMSEMQQAMSNILNLMHQNAEAAIRAIR
jgi:hypothetical protein